MKTDSTTAMNEINLFILLLCLLVGGIYSAFKFIVYVPAFVRTKEENKDITVSGIRLIRLQDIGWRSIKLQEPDYKYKHCRLFLDRFSGVKMNDFTVLFWQPGSSYIPNVAISNENGSRDK